MVVAPFLQVWLGRCFPDQPAPRQFVCNVPARYNRQKIHDQKDQLMYIEIPGFETRGVLEITQKVGNLSGAVNIHSTAYDSATGNSARMRSIAGFATPILKTSSQSKPSSQK
jgi:hypothetical protein